MEVRASLQNYRVSARKARLLADQIRGKGVEEAISLLTLSSKGFARPLGKLVKSAVANAEEKNNRDKAGIDVDNLVVGSICVDEGSSMWRVPRQSSRSRSMDSTTYESYHSSAERALSKGGTVGQKVHPYGFRLGTLYGWQSNWYAERGYADQLHEDLKIREFIKKKLFHAGISKVVIERTGEKLVVNIHTARPGILIGKRGAEVETLRQELDRFSEKEIFINIKEIRRAELDAQLVSESVALQP